MPSVAPEVHGGRLRGPLGLTGTTVVYCYPLTGRPDQDLPQDGTTSPAPGPPQSCAFRDHHAELKELGSRVFGLSTQDTAYQREAAEELPAIPVV